MINDQELKKGNWVLFSPSGKKEKLKDRPVRVCQLLSMSLISQDSGLELELFYDGASVKPIPLSPEVLKACGFEKLNGTRAVWRIIDDSGVEISTSVELNYVYIDTQWGQASIKQPILNYLHQLQNLYFSLTSKELNYQP